MAKFGEPSHHQHMMAGVSKAAASPNTPKHLVPHLEARMAKMQGKMKPMMPKPMMKMQPPSEMDGDPMDAMPLMAGNKSTMPPMTGKMKRTAAKMSPKRKGAKPMLPKKPEQFF